MTLQLTAHFTLDEFSLDAPVPPEAVYAYTRLCELLLEPLRVHYAEALCITSGYRSPGSNAEAHGVSNSQHVANGIYCAADWFIPSMRANMRPVFDLIRQSPGLDYDQAILEHGPDGDVIHTSWTRGTCRREALEGATANASAYTPWPSVPAANA